MVATAKHIDGAWARDMIVLGGRGPAGWPRKLATIERCTVYPVPHSMGLEDRAAHHVEIMCATVIPLDGET